MQELPKPNPSVLFQPVTDGAVLLNPEQEIYFGLNAVGAEIWKLLPPVSTGLQELCGTLASVYPEVDMPGLMADVSELLEALLAEGLVVAVTVDAS